MPGTRLDIREQTGIIVATSASDGVYCVDERGHLHLPLAMRRWCRLAAGDRMLFAPDRDAGVLVAHPLAVLDRVLAGLRRSPTGGEVG